MSAPVERRFIPLVAAARRLKVDRRVLERLLKAGTVAGERRPRPGGGVQVLIHRQALAAYLRAQPRCVADGCDRRTIAGAGCSRHGHHGKRHSPQTRATMSAAARKRSGNEADVERTCGWCGREFELRASVARTKPGRFCSQECMRAWLHQGAGAADRLERLRDGRREWRDQIADLKAVEQLLDLDELTAEMPRQLRRSKAAVLGHIQAGGLSPAPNEFGLLLFTRAALDGYLEWLRNHGDGRLTRFNAEPGDAKPFRADWYRSRHGSNAEYGRLAASGGRPRRMQLADDELQLIHDMAARGKSRTQIALKVGVCTRTVIRALQRPRPQKPMTETPPGGDRNPPADVGGT